MTDRSSKKKLHSKQTLSEHGLVLTHLLNEMTHI